MIAYGQTGTGKTYTTFGPDINATRVTAEDASLLGMIPRACHELFERYAGPLSLRHCFPAQFVFVGLRTCCLVFESILDLSYPHIRVPVWCNLVLLVLVASIHRIDASLADFEFRVSISYYQVGVPSLVALPSPQSPHFSGQHSACD